LQAAFDAGTASPFYHSMKTLLAALLLCSTFAPIAQAETAVRGFNPRFSTSPEFPDEPNFRPANEPPSRFDITVDVDGDRWWERDRRRPCRDRHCRDGRPRR
jgi:hypothetical protein